MTEDPTREVTQIIQDLERLTLQTYVLTQELSAALKKERKQDTEASDTVYQPPTNQSEKRDTSYHTLPSNHPTVTSQSFHTFPHQFEVGDTAVITNNYLGNQGTSGTVTRISTHRVRIIDASGRQHNRHPKNLRRVPR